MIRQVDRLCVMDSLLLVADYALRSVFIFDREGRYRSRISRVGRSREEYLSMNAVAFDTLHGEVLVHDIMAEKLLVYGLDGTCRGVTGASEGIPDTNVRRMFGTCMRSPRAT